MANEKTMSLTELNSKIKENAENPVVQKALLILKGGLKAYEGTEFTEKQVKELVDVRVVAEDAAAEKAAELENNELFEHCSNLGEALKGSVEICFTTESNTEENQEELEEESSEEETTEAEPETSEEETEETETTEEESSEEEETKE